MTAHAREITDLLQRNGVRDVDATTLGRALYSSDASLYRVVPQVVVRPRNVDEVLATVASCREAAVPLTARGAGTSIAGNAVGSGVVMDLRKHVNVIRSLDPETRTATVEPGTVHAQLQRAAKRYGLRFGPDPSTHSRCTIGGMIGNNACGSRALGYGRTADNIVGLDLATIDGETLTVGSGQLPAARVVDGLHRLVERNLGTIRPRFGQFGRQISGYSLEHLLPERGFDVGRFMCGSEGRLAIVLGATVRLVEDSPCRQLLAHGYPDIASAADDIPTVLRFRPVACEGLDSRIVDVLHSHTASTSIPELPRGRGWLLVELAGDDDREICDRAGKLVAASEAEDSRLVLDQREQSALWRIREEGAGLAARALARPAHAGWEDAAVPPARLGEYLRDFDALLEEFGLDGALYGHFGDGCIHVRIDFPLGAPSGSKQFREFLVEAAHTVTSHQGSLSGEHGDGRARSELLPIMYSPEALALFGAVKALFDPHNLLNPGVLIAPRAVDEDLRIPDWKPIRPSLRLLDVASFSENVQRCTGVGKCVVDHIDSESVMCPTCHATRDEKDSTRGRARVLQEMVDGRLVARGWRSSEVHEALDLCLACKGCLKECPTGIDMAAYKAEVLHQAYRGRLCPRSHYVLGWLPWLARLGSPFARLVNMALAIPVIGSAARIVAGVDQRRTLPRFARRRFRDWTHRHTSAPGADRPRVVLWADTFTEFFTTAQGKAAVTVLEDAGYGVEFINRSACCGLTWISTGQLSSARKRITSAIDVLYPYAAAGIPIVGLEPSCLAVLRSEALQLIDDPRSITLADNVFTLAELLSRTPGWKAPDLSGFEIVVQPHCHHASVLGFDVDLALLRSTGASVQRLGGCCGLAGNFGVENGHYELSVAVAAQQLLPAAAEAGPDAVILADGFSCRTQLADLAGRQAVHLAELLIDRH